MRPQRLKMYIVLRTDISVAAAIVAAAHAPLGTYLNWESDPVMQEWQKTSFVKILLGAKDKTHFDYIKKLGEHRVFTESTLNNMEVSLGFRVVHSPNKLLEDVPLWKL